MRLSSVLLFLVSLTVSTVLPAAERTPAVIAFAQDTMQNDFRKAQVFAVRDAVERFPELTFVYSDAQGKTSLLIRQIESFIKQSVDVLVVGTNDEQAVVPVISKAHASGIKVIVLDRGVKTTNYTTFINTDNVEIGATAGRYIAEQLDGQGVVLLFEGIQTADVTQLRSQGFMDVITQYPNIKVIKRTGNFLRRDSLYEMEALIAEGIEVDAIFSESDSMLSGVRAVLNRHQIDPASIIMVGVDYISEAQQAIRAGTQTGSVLNPLAGEETVAIARRILAGEQVAQHIIIPTDLLVTRDNVNQVAPIF